MVVDRNDLMQNVVSIVRSLFRFRFTYQRISCTAFISRLWIVEWIRSVQYTCCRFRNSLCYSHSDFFGRKFAMPFRIVAYSGLLLFSTAVSVEMHLLKKRVDELNASKIDSLFAMA